MHNDELVWSCCGVKFCSFRATFKEIKLCRNIYNVTGECSRVTCPLANAYYGTILEEEGVCYLYLKTIERAHLPRRMWEKIRLPFNTEKAHEKIEEHMRNVYKEHQIKRCKSKYDALLAMIKRARKLVNSPSVELTSETKKLRVREANREMKALQSAGIRATVEEELLQRLKMGHYGEFYNISKDFESMVDLGQIDRIEGEEDLEDDEEEGIETGVDFLSDGDDDLNAEMDVEDLEL